MIFLASLLYEQSSYETESFGAGVQGFDLTSLHELSLGKDIMGKEKKKAINGGSYIFNRAGFVGRVNYAYDGKYLLELAARYDGSVRFPKENRWGFFQQHHLDGEYQRSHSSNRSRAL
ncbi:MAG: hypothetical protein ACLTGI_12230 [Hoylesella buccalis]